MALKLYNTATRSVDEFQAIDPPEVSLYTCGPTVYNYAHVGNLRTYVFEDVLVRVLRFCGWRPRRVMNVTDVGHLVSDADEGEDKMEKGARREGKSVWQIAQFYWDAFRRDMERLHLLEPDVWCRATEHIGEQRQLVETLAAKGYTYVIEDGIYFDTSKFERYGDFAGLDLEGLRAGHRVEMVAGKRNPTDFAVWKFSPKDRQRLMEWDNPCGIAGKGFPGWHIECSAMAIAYLGERLDIHCGGVDHVNVHHTNEIAQAEAALGHKWCNWWLHGEFLTMPADGGGGRMSKSSGEFLTLDVLIERLGEQGYDEAEAALAYRYFLLNAHYRQQLAFNWDALEAAARAVRNLKRAVVELRREVGAEPAPADQSMLPQAEAWHPQAESAQPAGEVEPLEEPLAAFREAIEDDLNTPRALAAMWALLRAGGDAPAARRYATLLTMDEVLGFGVGEMEEEGQRLRTKVAKSQEHISSVAAGRSVSDVVAELTTRLGACLDRLKREQTARKPRRAAVAEAARELDDVKRELLRLRAAAKNEKDYSTADAIRDAMRKLGEDVIDLPDGGTASTSDVVLTAMTIAPPEDGDGSGASQ